jgi:hypothetical protein
VDDAAAGITAGQLVARRWHPGFWFAGPLNSEGWMQLTLDAERVRPGGALHALRAAAGQLSVNPAPWFPRAAIELNVGERLDVEADRVGHGAGGFIEANLRTTIGALGVESEQKLQHAVINREGRRALTDSAARWTARDSVRVVWQASRFRRAADSALAIAAAQEDTRTWSLVVQHRVGLSRSLSVGATRTRLEPARERKDEVFFKAAMAL